MTNYNDTQWDAKRKNLLKIVFTLFFSFLTFQVKLAKTVLLFIGVYIITWIPICVIHFLRVARIGNILDSVDLAVAFLMSITELRDKLLNLWLQTLSISFVTKSDEGCA